MPVHRTPNSVVRHRHQPYTPRSHHGNRRHGAGLFETLGHAGGSIVGGYAGSPVIGSQVGSMLGRHFDSRSVRSERSHNPSESVKTSLGDDTAQTTRGVAMNTHRNKKIHKFEKGHKVHVSKSFVAKVEKALEKEGKSMHGSWRQWSTSAIQLTATNYPEGGQNVSVPGKYNTSGLFNNDCWGAVGNVQQWIHMISVLWNQKPDSQLTRTILDANTIGGVQTPFAGKPNPNFAPRANNLQFTVKNSHEIYRFKNDSARTIIMKIYLCSPKIPTSENGLATNSQAGTGAGGLFFGSLHQSAHPQIPVSQV